MPRFLVEVPHEAEKGACLRAVNAFLTTGSHFLTNADWGCYDGEHKAWIILDLDSKKEALSVLPPGFQSQAKVVQLNKFSMDEVEKLKLHHQGQA
jgi:hypothetical protein